MREQVVTGHQRKRGELRVLPRARGLDDRLSWGRTVASPDHALLAHGVSDKDYGKQSSELRD